MSVTRRVFMLGAGALLAGSSRAQGSAAFVQPRPLKVGVFISERDAQGVDELVEPYVSQMRLGLGLAVSEINARGGILGRRLELRYRDDGGSPPSQAATAALVDGEGCEALVSGFVMAAPQLLSIRLRALGQTIPVIHGFWTDGGTCGAVAAHVAPTMRQIVPAIRSHLGDGPWRPFSISTWTPSGRRVSEYLYGAAGGVHTGDALVTTPVLGNHPGDYRGVIRWAHEMESTVIWQADPRPYAVNTVNQAVELGLAQGKRFAFLDFSEWQASQLRPGASVVTCIPFVATDQSPAVQDFVARARAFSGDALVTHVAFTHYNALQTLRLAMERSGEATAAGALRGFEGLTLDTATGPLTLNAHGYAAMPLFVATARGGSPLEVVEKLEPVNPETSC